MLSDEMKRVVAEQKLGFVASVDAEGAPNLSPKGTFLVRDDAHIMFGEMRSPNTVENLTRAPILEVNFVDPLARKGFRFKGPARYVPRGEAEFEQLLPGFVAQWGDLCELFKGIVVIQVERALPLSSPAYDIGAKEADLRAQWLAYFTDLNSG